MSVQEGRSAAPELRRPRAILFDWDNTLIDSWPVIHDALNATLEAFGMAPWSLDETRLRVGKSLRDTFPALFGGKWKEAEEVFYRRFADCHLERLQSRPGAGRMLAELRDVGFYLGIVSNKRGDYLRREVEHLGWRDYFGRIVGANDAAQDKPAKAPVAMALSGSGVIPGRQVWVVGDAGIDLECALNADCLPVLVREHGPRPGEFAGHPPAVHVADCQALGKLVGKL